MSIVKELTPQQKQIIQQYIDEIRTLTDRIRLLNQAFTDIIVFGMPEEADSFDADLLAYTKKAPEDLDLNAD